MKIYLFIILVINVLLSHQTQEALGHLSRSKRSYSSGYENNYQSSYSPSYGYNHQNYGYNMPYGYNPYSSNYGYQSPIDPYSKQAYDKYPGSFIDVLFR